MEKCKDFYNLISNTIREEWKNTSNEYEVSEIRWDDESDRFLVTTNNTTKEYQYEDFFRNHTHTKNKRGYDPSSMIPSIVCLLNVLDIINEYPSGGLVRDEYLHKYVAERYDDVEYGLSNGVDMDFLTENVREFLIL